MSIESSLFLPKAQRRNSGIALVITLALLVLVAVAVTAFMTRSTTNQQITTGSSNGVVADVFADGATQEIISGLQKEMWDTSGQPTPAPSPSPAPILFPMTNPTAINPSREVNPNIPAFPTTAGTPNPNAPYAQFANLVKQSYSGVPTYSGGTSPAPSPASSIPTTTAAVGGTAHDGAYWNQPQLASVLSSDTTTLNYLVPDWIYTARDGTHPTVFNSSRLIQPGGSLSSNSVVGRYAYNIYDIGGLLNANVAGYGAIAPTVPNNNSADNMIIPGYKGSSLMADLSGLALGGTLSINNASTSSISGLQHLLTNFRYSQTGSTAFALLFGSGQYAGWLQPFLPQYDPGTQVGTPISSTYITSNSFLSRQDLITWVNSQLATQSSGGGSPTWVLPYLTHFSYDTDAPTYTPDPARRMDTASVAQGGNDAANSDQVINPSLNSPTATNSNNQSVNLCDTNGYPLVKGRFPLSAISLFNNIYPGKPPVGTTVISQIRYDFGLVWNNSLNCWDYQDWEGGTSIKKISDIAALPTSRSPNFFELLKAAITAGSLGKQWGEGYDNDPNYVLGNLHDSSLNFQIIQIGANIISQATPNYYPTDIHYTDNSNDIHFWGVKDLPYLYRTRVLYGTVGTFNTPAHMHANGTGGSGYSKLGAIVLQPELWNPHAPNTLSLATAYPKAFRVVPNTVNPVSIRTYHGSAPGISWEKSVNPPTTDANALPGIVYGDYQGAGGPYLANPVSYKGGANPNAYIQFSCPTPSASANTLNTYREPVPLAAPGFPDSTVVGFPSPATLTAGSPTWDGSPNTQIAVTTPDSTIPPVFSSTTSHTILGFLMGYYCAGPALADAGSGSALTISQINPAGNSPLITTTLQLQYSIDGTTFYPYDYMSCAEESGNGNGSFNISVSSNQQTEVGTRVDPRSQRWGNYWMRLYNHSAAQYDSSGSLFPGLTGTPTSDLTTYQGSLNSSPQGLNWKLGASNQPLGWLQINQGPGSTSTSGAYYADPDGVYRPADGAYASTGNVVGLPEVMVGTTGGSSITGSASTYDSRPVVLNRPFQSVAELGYVFRDTPWRSLDFISPQSGDSALLDVFCVYGPDPWSYAAKTYNPANLNTTYLTTTGLTAGKVNLNTHQIPVLAALLKGAFITTPTNNTSRPATLTDTQSTAVAGALVGWTTSSDTSNKGPLRNPAELVGKLAAGSGSSGSTYSGFSSTLTGPLGVQGSNSTTIKQQRECVMHALADSGTTRTWNLFIDLVAQTGQLAPNASSTGSLGSFVVKGEQHVWVSVAIDRATGKIIKMQTEPVRL